eukprot:scaffold1866_cov277-Pinguiococcus_pyrenoidosus.AAC.17
MGRRTDEMGACSQEHESPDPKSGRLGQGDTTAGVRGAAVDATRLAPRLRGECENRGDDRRPCRRDPHEAAPH